LRCLFLGKASHYIVTRDSKIRTNRAARFFQRRLFL
jgi:hypothetical protein